MRKKSILTIFFTIGIMFFLAAPAHAATITVTNTNDAGAGSLRQAIIDAAAGDTIDFSVTGTITLTGGELTIGKNLTITGPGASSLTIDGNNNSRIFMVSSGFTLTLSGVTIDNGNSGTWGGGIANEGTLHISDSVITNCDANGFGNGYGGGIDNYGGTVTITNCTISGNTAVTEGGGIRTENGSLTVTESTISGNTSDNGGGINNYSTTGSTVDVIRSTIYNNNATSGGSNHGGGIFTNAGTLTVTNSTISGNSAINGGGGIIDAGSAVTMNITNCTIAYNTSTNGGGGLEMDFTTANIKNTILALNTGGGGNNFFSGGGSLNSQGYNLEDATECGFTGTGDQQSGSANLTALADNGGPTHTHALQVSSDAVDAIPGPGYNGAPGTDQRGVSRPQSTGVDCGAFELEQAPQVTTQAVSGIGTNTATGNGTITSLGAPNPTAHGMVWNTTGNPTLADSSSDEGAAAATGAFTSSMTGLSSYTTYYVKAYATNTNGTAYGNEISFMTQGIAPAVTTQAVSGIGTTTAVGNGNITTLGIPNPTAHGMVWNTTGNPTLADSSSNEGAAAATGPFTSNITGLSPGVTYYVKAYVTNAVGTAYGNEVTFTTVTQLPTVTTQAVSGIGTTSATGNGTITSLGAPNPTAHGMVWNITGNPTLADSSSNEGAASATGPFTSNMTGLSAGVTYYVKAYAINAAGTVYGNEVSFTTTTQLPTVTTQAVSGIGATTATGNGNITGLGAPNPTAHGMVWNTTGNPTLADSSSNEGAAAATGPFTSNMTGLSAGVTYYVKAYATNAAGTVYGNEVSFTTTTQLPTVTTQAVSGIGTTTATGNGNITGLGAPNPTAHGMVWNTTGNPTLADFFTDEGAASATGAFTSNMTGLTSNTTYYVKAYATNAAGTVYGNEVTFTTTTQLPTVTTQAVSGIGTTTATGNGNITGLGAPNPTAHGMVWNTTGNPTLADSSSNEGAAAATGPFTSNMTGLSAGVTYYVKAYATNAAGTAYGNEVTFTTTAQLPTVTTQAVSGIGTTTATGNGNITGLGAPNPTAHGMVWNTTGNPTLVDNFTDEGPAAATGAFTSDMTGLTPNTTYYVRAYATNAAGTVYGGEVNFTTGGGLPAVSTSAAADITDTSATCGGKVTDEGGSTVTARGVCWNTSSRPTVRDDHTVDGSGTGWFTSYLTELTPDTTYYYRAYATNTFGTAYGREKSFTSKSPPEPPTVQILDPKDGANVSGVVTVTANAEGGQGIKNVEFYVDGDKIGDGTLTRASGNALRFDLTGAVTLFIDSQNTLKKRDAWGNSAAVLNFDIKTQYICAGPDGHIYALFKSPQKLADGSFHLLVKMNPRDGSVTGIDPHISALFTGFKTSPVLQFDGAGNLYYFSAQGSGNFSLMRYMDKTNNRSIFTGEDIDIDEWLVRRDGTIILAGKTKTTGSRWLKIAAANQTPILMTDLFSDIEWIVDSVDGYAYAGTTSGVYRVSDRQAVEIPPDTLPADAGEKESGMEISLEIHGLPGTGNTYGIDWDTSLYDFGLHTIKAVAFDNIDQTGEDSICVNIPEIILTLTASKENEKAWIISRLYGKLEILVENLSGIPVSKYITYRKVTDGEFKVINTFIDADLIDGTYSYNDKYLESDKTYTFKVEAVDADETVIALSAEVTI